MKSINSYLSSNYLLKSTHFFLYLQGDKIVFTGTLAVIPDSGGLSRVGEATLGGKT